MANPVVALIAAGTTLVGGAIQSRAAGRAASAQQQASEQGIAEQQRQFNVQQARLSSGGGGSPYAGIRELQGGLYDLNTGQFIVQPRADTQTLNEQQLQSAFGAYAAQNSGAGKKELEAQAASGGLDPQSEFVQNTIKAVSSGTNILGKIRGFLGF